MWTYGVAGCTVCGRLWSAEGTWATSKHLCTPELRPPGCSAVRGNSLSCARARAPDVASLDPAHADCTGGVAEDRARGLLHRSQRRAHRSLPLPGRPSPSAVVSAGAMGASGRCVGREAEARAVRRSRSPSMIFVVLADPLELLGRPASRATPPRTRSRSRHPLGEHHGRHRHRGLIRRSLPSGQWGLAIAVSRSPVQPVCAARLYQDHSGPLAVIAPHLAPPLCVCLGCHR